MENSVLKYLKRCDGELYGRMVRTLKVYRGIDFEEIRQEDVMVVSPEEALEYSGKEGDKYFKVWMAGEKIAWCTWANTLVDSKFRWNAKARGEEKRDNGDLLGREPYVSAYLKSYDAVKECSTVYMFPFAAFGKKEEAVRRETTDNEAERAHKERMKQMEIDERLKKEELKAARKERERQREREEAKEEEQRAAEEEKKREAEEKAEVAQIMNMQLNDSDPKMLTKELLELSAKIDAIGLFDLLNSKTGSAMRGKFHSGLVMLKTMDPKNAMIKELSAMERKWRVKAMSPFILMVVTLLLWLILEKAGIISGD